MRAVRVPAGAVCSSCRAELVALRAALAELQQIEDLGAGNLILVCTDSQSSLAMLQAGPDSQKSTIGAEIWQHLIALAAADLRVHLQWVPAHCGLPGNERADTLAKEAAEMPQDNVPTDISAAVGAVARKARLDWVKKWRDDIFKAIMGNKLPVGTGGGGRPLHGC